MAAAGGDLLVGRAAESHALLDLTARAAAGRPGFLLVAGEAGVGKTALARDLRSRVAGEFGVLWAPCLPLTSLATPFLPLLSALRDWPAGGPPDFQPLTFDRWLDDACRERPLLLVVDDLHWADGSTLEVLTFVLAMAPRRRLAVLATLRTDDLADGHPLHRWLADVRRFPEFGELPVARLDRAGTADQLTALFGRPPRESVVDEVFARTRGNPYLTALLARGLDPDAGALPPGLPDGLRGAVTRAWHGLAPADRRVSVFVAVAGRPVTAALLAEAVGGPVLPALRAAVDARVLEVTDDRYWFVHPLLAEVLEATLLPEERHSAHTAFAAILSGRVTDVAGTVAVADHYHRCGDVGQAYAWALRGAEAAQREGGAAEAVRLLDRALFLLPAVPAAALSRLDLLDRVRVAADRAGDQSRELRAVEEMIGLVDRRQAPLAAADLLVRRMRLLHTTGGSFADVGLAREALELTVDHPDSPERALATAALAHAELFRSLPDGAARARAAVELAEASGSARALAYALTADTIARCIADDPTAADRGRQAQTVAAGIGEFWAYKSAGAWVAGTLGDIDDQAVIDYHAECRAEMTALGMPHNYAAMECALEAFGLLLRGDPQACAERLREVFAANPGPFANAHARLVAALLAVRQGRTAEARGHLARAEELTDGSGFRTQPFDLVRVEIAGAAGDAAAAIAAADRALSERLQEMYERVLPPVARVLADQIRDADPEPARAALADLRRRYPTVPAVPEVPGARYPLVAEALRALYDAEVERAHRTPAAADAWRRAHRACHTASLPWEEAYAAWRVGQTLLAGGGHRDEAASAVRRAHQLSTDLGSPLATEVAALATTARISLTEVAAEPVRTPPRWGLTDRESEILTHIVAGRTYAEIARTLVISEKTVSAHVSHMLAKTGATNRLELSQLALRHA
ncbi:AAA ATPase-like protein [Asanoa ferruginea]|uniref:AAA ATPase-like protein n=1 Tax=Asanoa ferruginea TaxID=53367 RepID=A0A3D9ZQQ8_9ACTN|nr:AAA family ATPase [Asanoa ferruginea]REF99565.1 AAA ATPase-like protein [Asanoa ferruginea]GIF52271.1 LuxR family transcriptional regulator [Asanoa ferruginea]